MIKFKDLDFKNKLEISSTFLQKLGYNIEVRDWPFKFRIENGLYESQEFETSYIEINDKRVLPQDREQYFILFNKSNSKTSCLKGKMGKDGIPIFTDYTKPFIDSFNEVLAQENKNSSDISKE